MDAERDRLLAGLGAPAGLCADCRFALLNQTRRGTVYLRCAKAAEDPAFPRYPRLPVTGCRGYDPVAGLDAPQPPVRGSR